MGKSQIDYVTATWNPVEGCRACSPGCDRCWARTLVQRYAKNPVFTDADGTNRYEPAARWDGTLVEFDRRWNDPHRWHRPQRILVGSRSDIALWTHRQQRTAAREMYWNSHHAYLLLTKRPAMLAILAAKIGLAPYAWFGTTICTQYEAELNISELRALPVANRWLSIEPMLAPIALPSLDGIGWVVCGGESGKGAREVDPRWIISLRDQCTTAGVPFWFKQWSVGQKSFPCLMDLGNWCRGQATIQGVVHRAMPPRMRVYWEAASNG